MLAPLLALVELILGLSVVTTVIPLGGVLALRELLDSIFVVALGKVVTVILSLDVLRVSMTRLTVALLEPEVRCETRTLPLGRVARLGV